MAKKTKVVHCKKDKFDVYIGRPGRLAPRNVPGSDGTFGNPFIIGVDGTRDEVLEKFKNFLLGNPALQALAKKELDGKRIACWCTSEAQELLGPPERCHGHTYIEVLDLS